MAGTTWDGGGANASWGTANNWSGNTLPLFNGLETITISGALGSGTTLTLDGSRYLNDLVINTTTGFTISTGTGGTLNLRSGNLTRNDVGGTEAIQTISAGIVLGDPTGVAAYTGTWSIAGSNSLNITGNIAEVGGSRGITKTGVGTLILSGTNSFSGGLTINAGTISISSDANLGASSGSLTFGGGTLAFTNNVAGSRAIVMSSAGIFSGAFGYTMEESGVVSGNGNLTVTGSGTLILSGSGSNGTGTTTLTSGVLSLRGTVSLGSGNLTITSGVLELGNGNFTRALGAAAGQVNMSATGGAGFAAYGADRTVNLGGSGATVTWGSGNFVASGQPLYLGTPTADHMIDFQNPINLNAGTRTISVTDGVGTGIDAKISGVISGAGASNLVMNSVGISPWNPGTLLLSNGNNSYAGTTTVIAGTLLLSANATGTAGNTVLGSGASDILIGNTSGTFSAGLLTDAAVTISRNIRAQSGNTGAISIGGYTANASTFSGNIFLGTDAIATGKGVTLTAASGGTVTFSGIIQDPTGVTTRGVLTKDGAGTVVLSGVNTYAGGTIINGGTLSMSQVANLGAIGGGLTINAGTLEISTGFSTSRAISLGDATSTFQIDPSQTYTVTSAIAGSGSLNKTGSGTMVLSGANNYAGGTIVSAGTLQISSSNHVPDASALTVSGGTFNVQSFSETVASVTLTSGSINGTGAGTVTALSYAVQSGTASAILAGTGATMTKTTSGTVTLSGANTFTGATTVTAGTLVLAAPAATAALGSTSSVTVNAGGTLMLGGDNQINDSAPITLFGGTFAKGDFHEGTINTPGVGALSLTASGSQIDFGTGTTGILSFASFNPVSGPNTFTLTIANWTGTASTVGNTLSDRLIFASDPSAYLSNFSFEGYAPGAVEFLLPSGLYEVVPTAVPEPSTWVAAVFAFGAIVFFQCRRVAAKKFSRITDCPVLTEEKV
jgi:fibronectin-binding autotransporter adhesin